MVSRDELSELVAVIGMAGRFPGATNLDEFWHNLSRGIESITFSTPEEVVASGVRPDLVAKENFVPAAGVLAGCDGFDAAFFDMNRRQGEILDPQHRLFLECCHAALENAGYDPASSRGPIAVYGGASLSSYWTRNLYPHHELRKELGYYQLVLASDKDFLTTRVAYQLNLRGPCLTVQTACSTSLVAVHLAAQALLNGECDMALAGGVSATWPPVLGYFYREGGILSPDGHCRVFDARAGGTVYGQGVGVVVLKRLDDALAESDSVRAVIRGSALNNDGSQKVGFSAPSLEAQREVIKEALGVAGVDASTVSYVEAHGTGTELGDPIEVAALIEAFRTSTEAVGFCALGSVKSNIGHLDAAAGIAGLIKTILAMEHEQLPPSLHFEEQNPRLGLDGSPFYVNDRLTAWRRGRRPRRAGVSSFGIGGTNAHVIVEEPPAAARRSTGRGRRHQLLLLSARTRTALEQAADNLARHLRSRPGEPLADVAFTLHAGRRAYEERLFVVARDSLQASLALAKAARRPTRCRPEEAPGIAFLFPGQGAQTVGMGEELYREEKRFRDEVDRCCELLLPHLGRDLRRLLYPPPAQLAEAAAELDRTAVTQPALFVVEFALARLWMSWGVRPQAMLGHSVGELVAACLAGVLRLKDALELVAERGRLLGELSGGAMLAVPVSEAEIGPRLSGGLSLAAVNAPRRTVVSGPTAEVEALARELAEEGVATRRLQTSHAFHSAAVEPALRPFAERVARVPLEAPEIPFLSNVTGTWITAAEACDASYWSRHLRSTVRFSQALDELLRDGSWLLVEVGPGRALSTFARQRQGTKPMLTVASLPNRTSGALEPMLTAAGRLWLAAGVPLDAAGLHADRPRRRIPLPTYPFDRVPHRVEPPPLPSPQASAPDRQKASAPAPGDLGTTIERQLAILDEQLETLRAARPAEEKG